jgi:Flp pilus assembly protein TadB
MATSAPGTPERDRKEPERSWLHAHRRDHDPRHAEDWLPFLAWLPVIAVLAVVVALVSPTVAVVVAVLGVLLAAVQAVFG